ncbi:MAG: LpqB family beta-propeller domain-containing protein [Candidatus Aminicenantes bacterium]|nr:LpqB family beta-propeller domain-containing protein [Candidatus Aminicenantes bacterium]
MKRVPLMLGLVAFAAALLAAPVSAQDKSLVGARQPSLSPDGRQVAFSYMGDIWVVGIAGGRAAQLTNNAAYEREPVWSPDGRSIAFTSNRNGTNDVFLVPAAGGVPLQLTWHSGDDLATDFTPDGRFVIFRSNRSSSGSLYKVPVQGGTELPVLETYWNYATHGRISPDGKTLLFSWGSENGYWWRRGYRGSNTAKLWTADIQTGSVRKIVDDPTNAFWPDWRPDGAGVYFVSDRSGVYNIWTAKADGSAARPVTKFDQGDVRWMSVAAQAPWAVYERDFGIWATNLADGASRRLPIEAPAETKDNRTIFVENAPVTEFRVSPDGKKIAAVVRGEVFVVSAEGGYARNVTNSPWREQAVDWDKDGRTVFYISDAGANPDIYAVSALGGESPRRLTSSPEDETSLQVSPDGQWIAYYRGARELRLMRPDGKDDRLLAEMDFGGRFAEDFVWSPDGKYLAVVAARNGQTDVLAIEAATGKSVLMTNSAYDEGSPVWTPDGKTLLFSSNRTGHSFPEFTGQWDLYRLFLQPRPAEFDEDDFDKLFAKEEPPAKPEAKPADKAAVPVVLKLEDLDRQTEVVAVTLGSEQEFVYWPKDESVLFVSSMDGRNRLWKTSLKKKERGRYEPHPANLEGLRGLQLDRKGEALYYLTAGRIGRLDLAAGRSRAVTFETKIQVDKTADYEQMLGEVFYVLDRYYYDPAHHKADWKALYERFRPVLQQVREDQDFADYANLMIGELNSSHMGFSMPRTARVDEPTGHVGAVWAFEDGKAILSRLIKDGPLYDRRDSAAVGDELVSVDGKAVDPKANFWTYFNGKVDKRVKLVFKSAKTQKTVEVAVKPIAAGAENGLLLEEWIAGRKEAVKAQTGDAAAYIYMRAMGTGDLTRFLLELERDAVPRRGLILDLRYNNGGNVHDKVLEALMKPVYAKWRKRGLAETPQSTFGFADKPVVVITNEMTLSDGEMTTSGFKSLKRGPVVGATTYGWLIFTTSDGLMNGGSFRLPFWGCFSLDGKDLETSGGVVPDIAVPSDLGHSLKGQDPQLDRAVVELKKLMKK